MAQCWRVPDRLWYTFGAALLLASGILLDPGHGSAATPTILYRFDGTPDGATPTGSLVLLNGKIYGTTGNGGNTYGRHDQFSTGTVYSIDLSTEVETVIHRFVARGAGKRDGCNPGIGLISDGTTLYGATTYRPKLSPDDGLVFQINPTDNVLTAFNMGATDRFVGSLLMSNHTLYGTTEGGGKYNFGSIFIADPADGKTKTIISFEGGTGAHFPSGGLVNIGSLLYGETNYGGKGDYGTLYQVDPSSRKNAVLYSFTNGVDGARPAGPMAVSGNILYGATTTAGGGYKDGCPDGCGTIFSFDTSTNTFTVLHTFVASDGAFPLGGVTVNGGILYGTTSAGGNQAYLAGTIFQIDLSTGTFTNLYDFTGRGDGGSPHGAILVSNGTIYGTTTSGGYGYGLGTVFSLTP